MEFKAAKCPKCNGELRIPQNMDIVKCMYCGGDVDVKKAVLELTEKPANASISDSLENWKKLAETAKKGGTYEEAITYYNKILEVDSKNADAWYGKGESVANSGKLGDSENPETIYFFKNAIDYADDKDKMRKTVISLLSQIIISSDKVIENMKPMSQTSAGAKIIENAKRRKNDYLKKIKELDPTYKYEVNSGSSSNSKSSSNCFIATAAYGGPLTNEVEFLRHWRDEYLLKSTGGRLIVGLYYRISPPIAYFISKSEGRRVLVRNLLNKWIKFLRKRHKKY